MYTFFEDGLPDNHLETIKTSLSNLIPDAPITKVKESVWNIMPPNWRIGWPPTIEDEPNNALMKEFPI